MLTTKFLGLQYEPGLGTINVFREKRKIREKGKTIKKVWLRKEVVETEAERYLRLKWQEREKKYLQLSEVVLDGVITNNREHIERHIQLQGHDLWVIRPRTEKLAGKHYSLPNLLDYVA